MTLAAAAGIQAAAACTPSRPMWRCAPPARTWATPSWPSCFAGAASRPRGAISRRCGSCSGAWFSTSWSTTPTTTKKPCLAGDGQRRVRAFACLPRVALRARAGLPADACGARCRGFDAGEHAVGVLAVRPQAGRGHGASQSGLLGSGRVEGSFRTGWLQRHRHRIAVRPDRQAVPGGAAAGGAAIRRAVRTPPDPCPAR